MLFAGAKVSQLAELPQGQVEAPYRVAAMVKAMAEQGFGNCTNHYECEGACPKGIKVKFIARMNWEFTKALVKEKLGILSTTKKASSE
jgi:succinate dehydrogenase / fumarate reductase iron-sulfur subunit